VSHSQRKGKTLMYDVRIYDGETNHILDYRNFALGSWREASRWLRRNGYDDGKHLVRIRIASC
jgi:hypothetical protein